MSDLVMDIKWQPPTVTNCDPVESDHWMRGADWHTVYLAAARQLQQPCNLGIPLSDLSGAGGSNWWNDAFGWAKSTVRMPAFSRRYDEMFMGWAPTASALSALRLRLYTSFPGPTTPWNAVCVANSGMVSNLPIWSTTSGMSLAGSPVADTAFPLLAKDPASLPITTPDTGYHLEMNGDPGVLVDVLWLQPTTPTLASLTDP